MAGRTVWVYDRRVEWNGVVFDLTGPEMIAIDAPEGEGDHPKPKETAEDRRKREAAEARDRERVAMEVRGALAGQVRPDMAVVRRCPADLLPDESLGRWKRALGWAMARRKVSSRLRKEPERLVSVLLQGTGRPEGFPRSNEEKWAAKVDPVGGGRGLVVGGR